jgi:hypothetical protein
MLNLDLLNIEELQEIVQKAESDVTNYAKELFPTKPQGYVKAVNLLVKYAKAKIEAMEDRLKGRISRADKHQETANNFWRVLPDYCKWDN